MFGTHILLCIFALLRSCNLTKLPFAVLGQFEQARWGDVFAEVDFQHLQVFVAVTAKRCHTTKSQNAQSCITV